MLTSFFSMNCQKRLRITSSQQMWTHSLLCLQRLRGTLLDVIAQVPLNGRSTHLFTNGADPLQCYPYTTRFFAEMGCFAPVMGACIPGFNQACPLGETSQIYPQYGHFLAKFLHVLPIKEVPASLVSPACSLQSLGNRGDI